MFVTDKASGERHEKAIVHPSLQGMLKFCNRQPRGQKYYWLSCEGCACAQYAQSVGKYDEWLKRARYAGYEFEPSMWSRLNYLACNKKTFGNLARALRKEIREEAEAAVK